MSRHMRSVLLTGSACRILFVLLLVLLFLDLDMVTSGIYRWMKMWHMGWQESGGWFKLCKSK